MSLHPGCIPHHIGGTHRQNLNWYDVCVVRSLKVRSYTTPVFVHENVQKEYFTSAHFIHMLNMNCKVCNCFDFNISTTFVQLLIMRKRFELRTKLIERHQRYVNNN